MGRLLLAAMFVVCPIILAAPESMAQRRDDPPRMRDIPYRDRDYIPKAGDRVRLELVHPDRHSSPIPSAAKPEDYPGLCAAILAEDAEAVAGMLGEGKAIAVPSYKDVEILEVKDYPVPVGSPPGLFRAATVRILGEGERGATVTVPRDLLVHYKTVRRMATAIDAFRAGADAPAPKLQAKKSRDKLASARRAMYAVAIAVNGPPPKASRKKDAGKPAETVDPADKPRKLLAQAKALEKSNAKAALGYYREIVRDHGKSPEAKAARERIKALGSKSAQNDAGGPIPR